MKSWYHWPSFLQHKARTGSIRTWAHVPEHMWTYICEHTISSAPRSAFYLLLGNSLPLWWSLRSYISLYSFVLGELWNFWSWDCLGPFCLMWAWRGVPIAIPLWPWGWQTGTKLWLYIDQQIIIPVLTECTVWTGGVKHTDLPRGLTNDCGKCCVEQSWSTITRKGAAFDVGVSGCLPPKGDTVI